MNNLTVTGDDTRLVERREASTHEALDLGNISVDLATFKVTVAQRPANLTYREFELLHFLASTRNRVVSFDALNEQLWGSSGSKETRRLNVLVCRLRSKLRNSSPYRLETVRGRGYGLLAGPAGSPTQGREGGERE